MVDAPVSTSRGHSRDRDVDHPSSYLVAIGATKGELTSAIVNGGRNKVDPERIGVNGALIVEVVGDSVDFIDVSNGALRQSNRSDSEDSILLEAPGLMCDADRLSSNDQIRAESDSVRVFLSYKKAKPIRD